MIKIWYQNIMPSTPKLEPYFNLLRRDFKIATKPDTEVVIKSPQVGLSQTKYFHSKYLTFLNDREIMEGMLQAERENYDAVAIGCYTDPCLHEVREVLNIPVVGAGESSMLLAFMIGYRFAIVETHSKYVPVTEGKLLEYGVRSRTIDNDPVRPLSISQEEQDRGLIDPTQIIEDFIKVAKTCVRDGAEVVIPGCTVLSPILTQRGITIVDDVPIIDCVVAEIKFAEMLIELKRAGLPWISRKNYYSSPSKEQIEQVRSLFSYFGQGLPENSAFT